MERDPELARRARDNAAEISAAIEVVTASRASSSPSSPPVIAPRDAMA
ncbi:MAG: hypothetical protein WAL77_10335 [Candidatus Dormiibacterota bacterium]